MSWWVCLCAQWAMDKNFDFNYMTISHILFNSIPKAGKKAGNTNSEGMETNLNSSLINCVTLKKSPKAPGLFPPSLGEWFGPDSTSSPRSYNSHGYHFKVYRWG